MDACRAYQRYAPSNAPSNPRTAGMYRSCPTLTPMRIGLLFDYPQGGDGLERTLSLGLAEAGVDPGSVTFLREETLGLPAGRAEDTAAGFARLADAGVDLIVGPSISDNCLAARDVADDARVPAINYSGGERTRSEWMFHYQ